MAVKLNRPSGSHRVGFMPGDGIGPEVAWGARRCVEATGVDLVWEELSAGPASANRPGRSTIPRLAAKLEGIGHVLKGPTETGYDGRSSNPVVALKEHLGVFASVRHCRTLGRLPGGRGGLDILIFRQEGAGRGEVRELSREDDGWPGLERVDERAVKAGAASIRMVGREDARRYFDLVFRIAAARGRRRVTVAHKASAFRKTDGLWLRCAEEAAAGYPDVELEDQLVSHLVMQMARVPHRYEAVAAGALYGDIVGDLGVGLAGGLGMVPEVSYGTGGRLYTSVHGTAPKYVGLGRANPCAMILAAAAMLADLEERTAARAVEEGVEAALERGILTPDLAGEGRRIAAAEELVDAVIEHVSTRKLSARA